MAKIQKEFKLPKPVLTEEGYEWLPVVRVGRVIPFGYVQDEEDPDILLPIQSELVLLEKAKTFLKQYSYRDVANWLTEQSGRSISHVGLRTRVQSDQKRKTDLTNYRYLAKRYQEAAEKARKIEESALGRRREPEDSTSYSQGT
jgi:hypothetical protein